MARINDEGNIVPSPGQTFGDPISRMYVNKGYIVGVEITAFVQVSRDEIRVMPNHSDYDDDTQRASAIAREKVYAGFQDRSMAMWRNIEHADTQIIDVSEVQ